LVVPLSGDLATQPRPSVFKVARLSGTCVHSAKVFGCKLIAALSSSKRDFFGILRVRKRWLLWFASLLPPVLRSPRI
jgi:hypothetical protein